MTKPRIRKYRHGDSSPAGKFWECQGSAFTGVGLTPEFAYRNWQKNVSFNQTMGGIVVQEVHSPKRIDWFAVVFWTAAFLGGIISAAAVMKVL